MDDKFVYHYQNLDRETIKNRYFDELPLSSPSVKGFLCSLRNLQQPVLPTQINKMERAKSRESVCNKSPT